MGCLGVRFQRCFSKKGPNFDGLWLSSVTFSMGHIER